jgi:hypothetical protein
MFSTTVASLAQRAAFIDLLTAGRGFSHELGEMQPACAGQIVRVRANRVIRRMSAPVARVAEAGGVNLGALAAAFAERLQDAGMALTPQQSERCVSALQGDKPPSRRSLYYLTREIFVTETVQLATFNTVFAEIFGTPVGADRHREHSTVLTAAA